MPQRPAGPRTACPASSPFITNRYATLATAQDPMVAAIIAVVIEKLTESDLDRTVSRLVNKVQKLRKEHRQIKSAVTTDSILPTTVPVRPQSYTDIATCPPTDPHGIDPTKRRLHEVYVTAIKRTKKSLLRHAPRADGINTSDIVDTTFIGKSVTMFLIPTEKETTFMDNMEATVKFTILDPFDSLDISFLWSLPQHTGKAIRN